MGAAVLFCPSSAVQVLGQVSPSKITRQRVYSSPNESGRHLLCAHWRGGFFRRSTRFWPNIAATPRKKNVRFSWRVFTAAVGEEVSVEEPVAETTVEVESAPAEQPLKGSTNGEDIESSGLKTQRKRNTRRDNRNVLVNVAALIPGATFTGKVTTIQSFGAFVDIGAFTNGLVHISRLSKSYVKNVEDVVQVGQEVNVQVIDVDLQAKRISLMLKQDEQQQDGEGSARGSDREGSNVQQGKGARRGESQRRNASPPATTKLKKGETATGVVKNIIKSGVFVTLPDGVDGFLPATETNMRAVNVNLEAHFKLGQELTVRVLRIEKGRVRLTTKQEVDVAKFNESINRDVIGGATNPFEIAFRQNSVISSYLVEKQKSQDVAEGKLVESEPEAAVEAISEVEPSSLPPEDEVTELPSDDRTVLSTSVSVLEKADGEEKLQGNVASRESSEELIEELHGKSVDPGADEDADVEEVLAEKEAAIEGVVDAIEVAAAPIENVLVAGGTATNEVVAAIEEVIAPAEDIFGAKEATSDEVVGGMKEEDLPVEEAIGRSVVAVVEDSVAAVEKELAEQDVPDLVARAEEVSAAVEEVVRHVEGVVAGVEEAMAVVEKDPAKPEIVPPAEQLFGTGEGAGEEKLAGVDVAVAAVDSVVATVEEAVAAVTEELPEQSPVKESVSSVREAEVVVKEEKPVSKEEEVDLPLEAEAAQLQSEADLTGAQEKVDQFQENDLSPASQDPKVNDPVEEPVLEVKEASQEIVEREAFEVVGVNKQDN